jgi:uncharacterized protein
MLMDVANIVAGKREDMEQVCKRFGVSRFDVFGSAVSPDRFDPVDSDLDFLVEFAPMDPIPHAKAYLGLLSALESLFGRPIDLVEINAVTNPYFLESINRQRRPIYAA